MTNEIRTRHLIVTLPNVSGEEADQVAAEISVNYGEAQTPGTTATHALGESVLAGSLGSVRRTTGGNILVKIETRRARPQLVTPTEARELAGALLILADEAEVVHGTCRHCGRAIIQDANGTWVDPEAGFDVEFGDGMWRETCEGHDTVTAEHEPVSA